MANPRRSVKFEIDHDVENGEASSARLLASHPGDFSDFTSAVPFSPSSSSSPTRTSVSPSGTRRVRAATLQGLKNLPTAPKDKRFLILPDSKFRRHWIQVTLAIALYIIWVIPVRVGFDWPAQVRPETGACDFATACH
jgi:hypothetical protein